MTSDFTIPAAATALASLTSANVNAADAALLQLINDYKNGVKGFDILKFYKNTATLATDTLALAVSNMTRYIVVDTQSAAATDDLSTISGGSDGQMIYLIATNAARVITVKHNVGNIKLWGGADITLAADKVLKLFYNGTNWSDVFIPAAASAVITLFPRTALGASAASMSTGTFSTAYKHLRLIAEMRGDSATAIESAKIQFNGDATAANYYEEHTYGSGSTTTTGEVLGTITGGVLANACPAASAPANVFGILVIDILNYASTTVQRAARYQGGARSGTGTGTVYNTQGTVFWLNNAAAINQIVLLPNSSPNFVAGSALTLYAWN